MTVVRAAAWWLMAWPRLSVSYTVMKTVNPSGTTVIFNEYA